MSTLSNTLREALWPQDVAQLDLSRIGAVWLTAGDALFQRRLHAESRYATATSEGKHLIDKFLARTQLYNQRMREAVEQFGLKSLEVPPVSTVEDLTDQGLTLLHVFDSRKQPSSTVQPEQIIIPSRNVTV